MKDDKKKKAKAKKLTWTELRTTKTIGEWRRRNRQYAQRHYWLKKLQIKGAEVLKEAHGLYVVGQIGAWDAFADKIKRAIDLKRLTIRSQPPKSNNFYIEKIVHQNNVNFDIH